MWVVEAMGSPDQAAGIILFERIEYKENACSSRTDLVTACW